MYRLQRGGVWSGRAWRGQIGVGRSWTWLRGLGCKPGSGSSSGPVAERPGTRLRNLQLATFVDRAQSARTPTSCCFHCRTTAEQPSHWPLRPTCHCSAALRCAVQEAFPHSQGPQQESLVELLGPINERITAEALAAMEAGDAQRLGGLGNGEKGAPSWSP